MRLTQRRRKLLSIRSRLEKKLMQDLSALFKRQGSKISRILRRSNLRKRLGRIHAEGETTTEISSVRVGVFMKEEVTDEGWSSWKLAVTAAILLLLKKFFLEIESVENDTWESRGIPRSNLDFDSIVRRIEARTGHGVGEVANITSKWMENEILAWYVSGLPFSDLMKSLDKVFGEARLGAVSSDLAGILLGQTTMEIMRDHGWSKWYWDAMGEDPCSSPVIVMNGVAYDGCLALHGKQFVVGDLVPPEASHPHCHCVPTPIPDFVVIVP